MTKYGPKLENQKAKRSIRFEQARQGAFSDPVPCKCVDFLSGLQHVPEQAERALRLNLLVEPQRETKRKKHVGS